MPETILTVRNRFIYMPKKRDKDVLAKVLWFEKRTAFDFRHFDLLHPSREVSHHGRYRSGVFHSKKCQRDIQYESSIELSFIHLLETDKRVVFYWGATRIYSLLAGASQRNLHPGLRNLSR